MSLSLNLLLKCLSRQVKWAVMYLGVDFASFYDVSIGLGNCANSVVFLCLLDLGIVPTVWYFCVYWTWELCRQCGIFVSIGLGNCADSVVFLLFILFRRICYSSQFVNMSHNLEHFISMSVWRFVRLLNWSIYSRSRLEIHPPFKSSMSVKYFVTLSTHLILISLL